MEQDTNHNTIWSVKQNKEGLNTPFFEKNCFAEIGQLRELKERGDFLL